MTPAPQLTPEIREKFLADLDYLLIAQETHAPNGLRPLERGIMQLVESAIHALSGPPSGELDFAGARALLTRLPHAACSNAECPQAKQLAGLRATLDQAESEIARLREENAELRLWVENHLSEVSDVRNEMRCHRNYADKLEAELARLRSSPPEETQRVAPVDVSVAYTFCERMAKQVTPYEYVITDADVREAYEAWTALDLAGLAAPSVSPSVPQEDSMAKTLSSQIGRTSRD